MSSRRRVPLEASLLLVAVLLLLLPVDAAGGAPRLRGKVAGSLLASSFLGPHNAARRAVGLRPLAWDERLAAYARGYAAARAGADCKLVHSHGPYGENLFRGSGGVAGWSPAAVVAAWVIRERAQYDRRSNTCRGGASPGACGHYTQIVWRGTTAVGCALAPCARGAGTIGVCVYNPPGNYVGMRPY